jgi:ACS family tartrate transporter-like MFS transporter
VLLRLNGRLGLAGWQWIFLVEAVPAELLAAALWYGLPERPAVAAWLSAEERDALEAEIAAEHKGAATDHQGSIALVLGSGRAWAVAIFYFCTLGSSYALAFSLPTVLGQSLGWEPGRVGYLIAVLGLAGTVLMLGNAWLSDRSRRREPTIVVYAILMAVGAAIAGTHLGGWQGVAGLLLTVMSFYGMQGPLLGVLSSILPGETSAVAIAFVNMFGIAGGFVGPYWMGWMRESSGDYAVGIGVLAIPCCVAAGCMVGLLKTSDK